MPNMKHKYGNASQVTTHIDSYADGGEVKKKKSKKPAKKPDPKILPPGSARKAGEQLKGRQAQLDQQMKDLGI